MNSRLFAAKKTVFKRSILQAMWVFLISNDKTIGLRVCPACLREDFCDDDPRGLCLYGRLQWQLGGFGTCPTHRLALVTLRAANLSLPPMDHQGKFRAILTSILAGDLDHPDPDGGAFEGHLLARLSGPQWHTGWPVPGLVSGAVRAPTLDAQGDSTT